MVNPESPSFKFSERVGFIIGKGIRYLIVGGVILYIGKKAGRVTPTKPTPNSPPPPANLP